MNSNHQPKRHPTILALSDDRNLIELLLKTCTRPWKVKVTDDFNSYLMVPDGECRVVLVDDEKLLDADRGWLLNKIQKRIPQAFVFTSLQSITQTWRDWLAPEGRAITYQNRWIRSG